jgi:hypothetical protein
MRKKPLHFISAAFFSAGKNGSPSISSGALVVNFLSVETLRILQTLHLKW